jgi:hypothetical protein
LTTAHVLWVINLVFFVAVVYFSRCVLLGRRAKVQEQRDIFLDEAKRSLSGVPRLSDLVQQWNEVLRDENIDGRKLSVTTMILALDNTNEELPEAVEGLRKLCEQAVNACNTATMLIDDGLLRPKDLEDAGSRSEQIERLLSLALVEPFIWFHSIVRGRGRWGRRPLRLLQILSELRARSHYPEVRDKLTVRLAGSEREFFDRMSGLARARSWTKFAFNRPTINVRSKLKQGRHEDRLRVELRGLEVATTSQDPSSRW